MLVRRSPSIIKTLQPTNLRGTRRPKKLDEYELAQLVSKYFAHYTTLL